MNKDIKKSIIFILVFSLFSSCFANSIMTLDGEVIHYVNIVFKDYTELKQKDENINNYLFYFENMENKIIVTFNFKKELKKKGGGAKYILDLNGNILEKEIYK